MLRLSRQACQRDAGFGQGSHVDHVVSDTPTGDQRQTFHALKTFLCDLKPEREDSVKLVQRFRVGKFTGLWRHGLIGHKIGSAELRLQRGFEPPLGVNIKVRGDSDSEERHGVAGQKSQYTRILIG